MSEIKLVRIDFRLMHGQILTNWLQQVSADAILIADDDVAKDQFLAQIYLMAAPPGVKVGIRTIEKTVQGIQNNVFKNKNLIILFKSVESMKKAVDFGFRPETIQIGGLGSGSNKVKIYNDMALSQEEAILLKQISEKGIKVILQATPKDPVITLTEALQEVEKQMSQKGGK